MAYIKQIRFSSVGKQEGCTCDKCGQYIRNIWTVDYQDGIQMKFGIDCFEKLSKGKLTDYGMKIMKKALKNIEYYQTALEAEKALTEETDIRYQNEQTNKYNAWYGSSWEEYHEWMINKWYPARFADAQKEIDRFRKVNFSR